MLNITIEQLDKLKASEALRAMVDGTRDNAADPLFRIEMGTFGEKNDAGICFGCVATCAIAKLNNQLYSETVKGLKPRHFHGFNFDFYSRVQPSDLCQRLGDFESAIDSARVGDVFALFEFTGATIEDVYRYDDRFSLDNDNWREELRKVEALIRELEAIGL